MKSGTAFSTLAGASDDKGVVTGSLQALLELHRQNTPLDRDVIFLGVADEEAGGVAGITYMLESHRDKIDAEYAINEAGKGVFDRDMRYVRFEIQTAEKTPRRIDLKAAGTSGHGSIPLEDNPIGALAKAVGRLFDHEMPPRLNETTREYFQRLAEISDPHKAEIFLAILSEKPSDEDYERLRELSPVYHSMVRTSIVPTILQGGYLKNVIPSEAQATVDIRALPDEDPERLFSAAQESDGRTGGRSRSTSPDPTVARPFVIGERRVPSVRDGAGETISGSSCPPDDVDRGNRLRAVARRGHTQLRVRAGTA